MRVIKVFNNNVVHALDDSGVEFVVMGRGIGFGAKPGQALDEERVQRRFTPDRGSSVEHIAEFLTQFPEGDLDLAAELVGMARDELGSAVADHLLLPIADHVSYALERARESKEITYPLRWEVEGLYPREVEIARRMLDRIEERTGVSLPQLEAIPLALHLVNAQFGSDDFGHAVETTEVFAEIISLVGREYGVELDMASMSVSRFITHLRYLTVRQQSGQEVDDGMSQLQATLEESNPREVECARKIRAILEERFHWTVNDDELVYLTVHVARLTAQGRLGEAVRGPADDGAEAGKGEGQPRSVST